MAKDNRINLRFSDDEIIELEEKADGKPLASFCRESVLRIRKPQRKKQTKYSSMPPEVARNLSAIGNNLNQITRLAHHAKKNDILEVGQLLDSIQVIREELSAYIETADDCKDV